MNGVSVAFQRHSKFNMVAIKAYKRNAADQQNALCERGILLRILSYVGPGHWHFLATVSSLWRDTYVRVAPRKLLFTTFHRRRFVDFTCNPQTTLYSSVFASPSRVRLAHGSGVDCSKETYQLAAGTYGTITALVAAHELGMDYTALTLQGAATCNKLCVLQFLHAQGCPLTYIISSSVARSGDLERLHWVLEHGCPYDR